AAAQVQAVAGGEVAYQAGTVGVVAVPLAVVAGQGVDRAGAARARAELRAQGEGQLLQRQGHIAAAAAAGGELLQQRGETVRRGVDGGVVQGDAELRRERAVDA